jgi:hypothetical protein
MTRRHVRRNWQPVNAFNEAWRKYTEVVVSDEQMYRDRGNEQKTVANTDREIWRRVPGDYYSPSVSVTESGAIVINVGGHCVAMSVEDWHRLAMNKSNCTGDLQPAADGQPLG